MQTVSQQMMTKIYYYCFVHFYNRKILHLVKYQVRNRAAILNGKKSHFRIEILVWLVNLQKKNLFIELSMFFQYITTALDQRLIKQNSDIKKKKQDCSYQGEALKVPTAFYRLWSSNNINNIKN